MKKIIYTAYTYLLAVIVMALTGCIDDEVVKNNNVVEGKPVTVSLKLAYKASPDVEVSTRAEVDNTLSAINNLLIFIYDAEGNYRQSLSYVKDGDGNDISLTEGKTDDKGHWYTANFSTTSGVRNLIAIANLGGGYWQTPTEDMTKYTYLQMKEYMLTLHPNYAKDGVVPFYITGDAQMLLTGCQENIIFTTNNTVTDINGASLSPAISLYRAMARITFKIPEPTDGATKIFTPTSYQVYNVPVGTLLCNEVNSPVVNSVDSDDNFINFASTNVPSVYDGFYTFSFYMPENVQNLGSSNTYHERDEWEGEAGATAEEKVWKNAPKKNDNSANSYSTFVVLNGTYSETGTTNYTGNVSYTIHLGDFSAAGSMANFSVERNTSYTYTVNVKGVDNIIVEAKKENGEYQQGAEGQIFTYDATTYSYELDAHYEQVFLEYNLSKIADAIKSYPVNGGVLGRYEGSQTDADIDNAIADNLILVIQSEAMDYTCTDDSKPYTVQNKRGTLRPYKIYADKLRGVSEITKDEVLVGGGTGVNPEKGFDYKWIEFWPQTTANIAKYPGVSNWSRENLNGMKNSDFYGETVTTDAQYLMDVYDVIVAMGNVVKKIYKGGTVNTGDRAEGFPTGSTADQTFTSGKGITVTKNNNDEYVARFTAFVNEYYYVRHPLTGEPVTTWSVFTNKIPREMIIAMSSSISSDGNSSFSTIYSYITQLAIQTFYNSRVSSINGFGIESYNETPKSVNFGSPRSENNLSISNGHSNQITLIGGTNNNLWRNYIEAEKNGWTNSVTGDRTNHKLPLDAYKSERRGAYSACLSRNRDLNGNGYIDENEVRWYLASLNEYIRIGIGSNALSNTSRLYMGDKMDMKRPTLSNYSDGYPTAYIWDGALYYTSSASERRIFWAAEKGSYSRDGEVWAGGNNSKPMRCIRALPATNQSHDITTSFVESDASFVAYNVDGNSKSPISLEFKDRLVDILYRERNDGVLKPHNENGGENSFYDGIIVAKDYLKRQYPLRQIINISGNAGNPCASYPESNNGDAKNVTWRVPNLVEFSAMNAAGLITKTGTACCTQFSNQDVRFGYGYNGNFIYCFGDKTNEENLDSNFWIRCVRDVPDGYEFSAN